MPSELHRGAGARAPLGHAATPVSVPPSRLGQPPRRLGVPSIPVFTAETTFDGAQAAIAFPNGQPDCFVCGTCKRRRVLAHQAAGRSVVLIGDGETDRYAAAYADHIFAKRDLIRLCSAEGWPFTPGATSGS